MTTNLLVITLLVLAVGIALTARFFLGREELLKENHLARERELEGRNKDLLNRLLLKNNVQPVGIEFEKTLKLPDPDTQFHTPLDEVYLRDEIKEEIEQLRPDAREMSAEEVESRWPDLWKRAHKQLMDERAPLVIE